MTDEPISVIEEYLTLVSEHLPESISDDVITELRTYMVETASDLGEGEVTLQSAKKVVAQFGAPSEVAEEYKFSMLPETIPPKSEAPQDESEPQVEVEGQEPRKDPTASTSRVFLQGVSIAVAWVFLVVLMSTLIGPVWLYPGALFPLLGQFMLVGIGLGVLSFHLKRQKTILWKRSYPEWSILQRFLTLPENVVKEPRDALVVVDILCSLTGLVMFLFSSMYSPTPLYIPLVVFPASAVFLAKAFYGGKRLSSQDPTGYIKGELALTFAALLLIDSSQIWLTNFYRTDFYLFMVTFLIYILLWGSVLLFQLVTRSGDFWWDVDDSEPTVIAEETEKLVQRTKNVAGSTILRLIGWIILFTIIPTYGLMISQTIHIPWLAAGSIAIFFGPIFLGPVVLYYLFRRWRIKSGKSKCIIGERTRVEALGDLAVSAFLFIGFISSILLLSEPGHLSDQYMIVFRDFGYNGTVFFAIGYVSAHLLLLVGLGMRIIGDCLEFRRNRTSATEMIMASGRILIFTLSLRVGIDFVSHNYILLPFTIYYWVLLLAILIAFQVEISRLKLRERKLMMTEGAMKVSGIETTAKEIPSNIRNSKRQNQYFGN
ncbi:MAG: hypothetical protein ThorAB25_05790 [Candidatus Thorarchaeota archaeon AB_25]|nr:MAG: hypothetical protein ThorAB25_05790 [Candidatus Thorarchaeota archaeon AB_25]